MQPIAFTKPGKIQQNKYINGIPCRKGKNTYSRAGVVQQITPNFTINGSPIADGNSLWAAMNLDTSIEGNIAVQLGFMPPELYAMNMGDTVTKEQEVAFPAIDEEYVIGDAKQEVTLKNEPIPETVLVVDIHNEYFTLAEAEGEPKKNEYKLEGDKLTFSKEDAGVAIFVTYDHIVKEVDSFGLSANPARAANQLVIVGQAVGENEQLYEVAIVVDKCKVIGAINPPTMGGEPQPSTITYEILKPRGGKRAVEYRMRPLAGEDEVCE